MGEQHDIGERPPPGDVLRWLLQAIREPVSEAEILTSFVRRLLLETSHAGRVCVWAVEADEADKEPRDTGLEMVASARPPGAVIHEEWTLDGHDLAQLPLTEPLIGQAVADGEPRWARDELAWSTYPDWAKRDGVFAYYAAPILPAADGAAATFGALAIFHAYRFLDPQLHARTIRQTQLQADLLGTAILRAREAADARLRDDRRRREVAGAHRARLDAVGHHGIVGSSAAARRMREQVALAAHTGAAVLVRGEPGAGRTLAAHAVVAGGERRDRPRAELNAATIPHPDLPGELADGFEVAAGGTLIIRRIDRLPTAAQLALLEHLERVDQSSESVQVIATAAPDLHRAVETGRFDPDLWNRLAVVLIDVPPLRSRPDDIPELAAHLAATAARHLGRAPLQPTPHQLRILAGHSWPGNVRELAAVIEQATLTARGHRLNIEPLIAGLGAAAHNHGAADPEPEESVRTEAEMRALLRANTLSALRGAGWVVSGPDGAAARLGIKPTTLAARMKTMGIERPR